MRGTTHNLAMMIALSLSAACTARADVADVEHGMIYAGENEFAAWPANEGLWSWGEEMLIGFTVTGVQQRAARQSDSGHNMDYKAYRETKFARSLDGGKTWATEQHPNISTPGHFNDAGKYVKQPGYPAVPEAVQLPGEIDFAHPDFALKARDHQFWYSQDRGREWHGPFLLPDFGQAFLKARTNYLVVDSQTLLLFYEVTTTQKGNHLRTMAVQTTDGGKTFQQIGWLTPDPLEGGIDLKAAGSAYACMPGVTRLDDGTLLAAVRWSIGSHKWVDLRASSDGGHTWERRSIVFDRNNNPASLFNLGDKRVAAIYGYRNKPYGVRAKISEDAGHTWSKEIVLLDDGREWDLGYVRVAPHDDGRVFVAYYHTTVERPDEFIAYTLWSPPVTTTPERQLTIEDDGTIIRQSMSFSVDKPGVALDAEHPLLKMGRGDFTITAGFTTPKADEATRSIINNHHALGGFVVRVADADHKYAGKLVLYIEGPAPTDVVTLASDVRVDDDLPHEFTITVNNGKVRMVLDGVEQSQVVEYGETTTATAPAQAPIGIGENFVGVIDHLRIRAGASEAVGLRSSTAQ